MGFDKLKLWYIHGRAYDLEPFLDNHPGGVPILRMVQGLNCTELFETYHFQNKPTEQLMEKYRVKIDPSQYTVEEKTKLLDERFLFEQDGFYNDVKRRVQKYFNEKGITHRGTSWWKWLLAVQMSAILIGMYYSFVVGSLFAAVVYGVVRGVTAVTSGHTLSHFSLFRGSANYWLFRFAAPLVLSNVEIWSTSHVISHHVYTLTTDDLQDNYPLKRIQPVMPWKPWHTFQHYYIWIVYAIGLPIWTLVDFFGTIPTFFTGKHEMRRFTMAQRIENFLVFGCNLTLTVFLPFFFHDFYTAALLSFVANAFASSVVVVQIAVNHEVPETMAKVPLDCKIDWGVHQVLTSHNYGLDSKFFLHLSGGLNLQVEHHLFPGLHYSHYFNIAPIVRQTCKEYGLPYNTSAHLWEAVQKHYDILKFNSTK